MSLVQVPQLPYQEVKIARETEIEESNARRDDDP
jgi:hypothetical protein